MPLLAPSQLQMLRATSTEPWDESLEEAARRRRRHPGGGRLGVECLEDSLERELREFDELPLPPSPPQSLAAAAAASKAAGGGMRGEMGGEGPAAAGAPAGEVRLDIGASKRLEGLARIEPLPASQRVTVKINAVSAHVPLHVGQKPSLLARLRPGALRGRVGAGGGGSGDDQPTHRQVLFSVSGSVRPGEVVALMGPSGSGKTSLLSVMGGRAQAAMRVEGSCTFNEEPLTKRLKRKIGYVMQDDLLYSSLTVQETLYYAAFLRLPREMSRPDKLARIDTVVEALGLGHCRETIIGGFMRKGISGGERKRCSIGVELLINPSVLMLDEPTSGLDASTSMHVLQTLRHLASGGRAIIATLHQPSSRLYQQLDKLLLLSQGHCMYYGEAQSAAEWWDRLGYTLPYKVSLPDFALDLANADVDAHGRDGEQTRLFLIEQAEAFLAKHPEDGFQLGQAFSDVPLSASSPSALLPGAKGSRHVGAAAVLGVDDSVESVAEGSSGGNTPKGQQHRATALSLDGVHDGPPDSKSALAFTSGGGERRWGAPYGMQFALLFQRSIRTRRFESMSGQDIAQFLIIAVLAGLLWLQAGQDETLYGARNLLGFLFFLPVFLSFRVLFSALFTFPDEYKHMLKERASGMYRLSAYFFARTASDLPMNLALPTLFLVIVYFMAGLRYNALAFFGTYGICLLSILVAQSWGLLLGVLTMNPKTAQTIASVMLMIFMLTGGFFVTNLPSWIGWLKYTSFVYYSLQVLLFIQFDGGAKPTYSCTDPTSADVCAQVSPSDPATNPECAPVGNLQQAMGLGSQNPASQTDAIRNACILLAMLLVLRTAVYVALRRKTARI